MPSLSCRAPRRTRLSGFGCCSAWKSMLNRPEGGRTMIEGNLRDARNRLRTKWRTKPAVVTGSVATLRTCLIRSDHVTWSSPCSRFPYQHHIGSGDRKTSTGQCPDDDALDASAVGRQVDLGAIGVEQHPYVATA